MSSLSRRRFLFMTAGIGGVAAMGTLGLSGKQVANGESSAASGDLLTFRRAGKALGTSMTITVLHARRDIAQRALDAAFVELDTIEQVMSLYRKDSEIRRLNAAGRLDQPHELLLAVLNKSDDLWRASGGAFDVTVQPLWDLYSSAKQAGVVPTAEQIAAARQNVDWRKVRVRRQAIDMPRGMGITLNGIAQGFAADRVMMALRAGGIEHALIDTGEIGALGQKASGDPWTVGIQHPRQPDAYIALAALDGRCMATSGDYATSFDDEHIRHHIFDPATGRSPQAFASVTVVAPTGIDADALSTAVFVVGVEKGLQMVKATPRTDAFFVLKDGRTFATEGFPKAS